MNPRIRRAVARAFEAKASEINSIPAAKVPRFRREILALVRDVMAAVGDGTITEGFVQSMVSKGISAVRQNIATTQEVARA